MCTICSWLASYSYIASSGHTQICIATCLTYNTKQHMASYISAMCCKNDQASYSYIRR